MTETFSRSQVTFYRSFYDAVQEIEDPAQRALAYDTLLAYAFTGEEPALSELPAMVRLAFRLIRPNLDASRSKAANAKQSKSKPEANEEQTVCKKENEIENKNKKEYKTETEKESYRPAGEFEKFWQAYPKKVGRREAEKAFQHVLAPLETLLQAVRKQGNSQQWQKECGRYIPNPATWLREERWNDLPPEPDLYQFGELELAAIERMMSTGIS